MTTAIIVAAGSGTRMGPAIDKLFLEIEGLPVIGHTWRRFDRHPAIDHIVLVVRESQTASFNDLAQQLRVTKPYTLAIGGRERQDSVWHGLQAAPKGTIWVAIQDGARPCTSNATIFLCLQAARRTGAAVAAQRVTDSIKEASPANTTVARHLDRSLLWSVQTPQCFGLSLILKALLYVQERSIQVTDDTAACGLAGIPVELAECIDPNPKVTSVIDLPIVAYWLRPVA